MATGRNTKSGSASRPSQSNRAKSSAKSTSKTAQKSRARQAPAPKNEPDRRWSILVFGIGLFFVILSVIPGESGWAWLRQWVLFSAFGISGWLIGPMIIWWAVCISVQKPVFPAIIKGTLFLFALSGAALIFGNIEGIVGENITFTQALSGLAISGQSGFGGGIISILFGYTLLILAGRVASGILVVLILIVAIMILTSVTPGDIVHFFRRTADKAADRMDAAKANAQAQRQAREEQYAQREEYEQQEQYAHSQEYETQQPFAQKLPPAADFERVPRRMTMVDVPLGGGKAEQDKAPQQGADAPLSTAVSKKPLVVFDPLTGRQTVSAKGEASTQASATASGSVVQSSQDIKADSATQPRGRHDIYIDDNLKSERGGADHVLSAPKGQGSFGTNAQKEHKEEKYGLGDFVPIVPFANRATPSPLPPAPSGDMVLFGEDDPMAKLGGESSKLPKGLTLDVEYIPPQEQEAPKDDPSFDLFNSPSAYAYKENYVDVEQGGMTSRKERLQTAKQVSVGQVATQVPHVASDEQDLPWEEPAQMSNAAQSSLPTEQGVSQVSVGQNLLTPQDEEDMFSEAQSFSLGFEPVDDITRRMAQNAAMQGEAQRVHNEEQEQQDHEAQQDAAINAMIEQAAQIKDSAKPSEVPMRQSGILLSHTPYMHPPLEKFDPSPAEDVSGVREEMKRTAELLVGTLESFGVQTRILDVSRGPSVTRYELQPQAGVKISRITNLSDDIALNLAAAGVRIEAPIPGKPAVGIEVPNRVKSTVAIRSILESDAFARATSPLSIALGKDIAGEAVVGDLTKMPHLLIAGSTGSGKSVCINSTIMSFLFKSSPEDVKMILIDPKVVELAEYNGIPHLLIPVVTEPRQAAKALGHAVAMMEQRYRLFAENNVRDIASFNKLVQREGGMEKMPHIAIVIDELADLMMVAGKDVENFICRIAQKARAAGMHLIVATQRPSVDVITGLIKANIPSRIAFAVSSQVDSRTILDGAGAEKLLGMGDMLFMPIGANKPVRVQGTFVKDKEISRVLDYIKQNAAVQYDDAVLAEMEKVSLSGSANSSDTSDDDGNLLNDETFVAAVEVALENGSISTSFLQRRLRLGYARAGRIMDQLERMGITGPPEGSKPRQVLISRQHWQEMAMNSGE